MNLSKLRTFTWRVCLASAGIGLAVTAFYMVVLARSACCDASYFWISGRFALDFFAAPMLVALSLGRFSLPGQALFWVACGWMVLLTWPPFLLPLVVLAIWTRVRLREERTGAAAGAVSP